MKAPIAPMPPPPPGWYDEHKREAIHEYRDRLAERYAQYDRIGFKFNIGLSVLTVALAAIGIVMILMGKL